MKGTTCVTPVTSSALPVNYRYMCALPIEHKPKSGAYKDICVALSEYLLLDKGTMLILEPMYIWVRGDWLMKYIFT